MAFGLPEPARVVARRIRRAARRSGYRLVARLLDTDEGRRLLSRLVRGLDTAPSVALPVLPYDDLGMAPPAGSLPPVFVTARFRSGSTLLWQIFRAIPGATAYYEPHNPRRWFDQARLDRRIDPSHRGVDNYWREYEGMEALDAWFQASWCTTRLSMSDTTVDDEMQAYLDYLVAHASGRPVLQCNHIDFRLPWVRRHYPAARLIHLYRHPRDQWMSTLATPAGVPREVTAEGFHNLDHYYLLPWARDLSLQFPFLHPDREPHPYRLFYLIWRLSHAAGQQHAHLSVSYEALMARPRDTIAAMLDAAQWPDVDVTPLAALVGPASPSRWADWAPASWFEAHEAACEAVLSRELRLPSPPG